MELVTLQRFVSSLASNTPDDYPVKALISRAKGIVNTFKIPHHSEATPTTEEP